MHQPTEMQYFVGNQGGACERSRRGYDVVYAIANPAKPQGVIDSFELGNSSVVLDASLAGGDACGLHWGDICQIWWDL
jgi:hypothetical protein